MSSQNVIDPAVMARRARAGKANLPVKSCAACARPMQWRRAWAKTWREVRYCSDACRKRRGRIAGA